MKVVHYCRVCGGGVVKVLDLGPQPPANALRKPGELRPRVYPLELMRCERCYHGQLSVVVPPAELYTTYRYASSDNPALVAYFAEFVQFAERFIGRGRGDTSPHNSVLEIACNDGGQLEAFRQRGWYPYGVEPSNLAEVARSKGISIWPYFWNLGLARQLETRFRAVIAQNVLGHVDDPHEFLDAIDVVLAPKGRVFLQTSHANWLRRCEFDTIYHEHVSFFNCRSWRQLLDQRGWQVEHCWMAPTNGTSYVLVIGRKGEVESDGTFEAREQEEKAGGYYGRTLYDAFGTAVSGLLGAFLGLLSVYRSPTHGDRQGWTTFGYGAAAKGITVLNACSRQLLPLPFVVDDSLWKQGLLLPGSNTPVVGPKYLDSLPPGEWCVLATASLYKEQIKHKLQALGRHGMLLTYFPEVDVEPF